LEYRYKEENADMPLSYQIDEERNLVLTTGSGILTDDDIIQHNASLLSDPGFEPGMRELSDIRGIDRLEVTTEGVDRMVQHDERHAPEVKAHRLAIVASQDIVYGMARMYQSLTEQTVANVRIFGDIEEARAWLVSD
jgi:hypothetical protein